ncbi:MAG: hypothetical protein GWO24_10575, partial [Akkermansiaceae bacterium]|nr:hypothetical protein [Akkermansiaceae bacterium]
SAATDWPGNNYIGRDRTDPSTGFKFFSWDNEHGMKPAVTENRTLPHSRDHDSPTKFHHPLRSNAEYRLLFADHLHRAFFNDGPLTPGNAAARWMEITSEIEEGLIAESARWGDYRRAEPYTVEGDFKPLRQSLVRTWFPRRSRVVLDQFRAQGLYPDVAAPVFAEHGGSVPAGHQLGVTAPEGSIHLTTDGSDPRLPGGEVNPAAILIGDEAVTLESSGKVMARALSDGEWSALNEALFVVGTPATADHLVISELLYKPLGGGDLEFVEIMNTSARQVELTGVRFSAGIEFTFPVGYTLSPGQRALVVDNRAAFEAEFGSDLEVAGEFSGDLDNGGETIALTAWDGALIRSFGFEDTLPWPEGPDRSGHSLTLIAPQTRPDHTDPAHWRSSLEPGGSPAATDASAFSGDPFADDDHDGHFALMEYALGTSDREPGPGEAFDLARTTGGSLILTYP